MIIVNLDKLYYKCIPAWQNFITYLQTSNGLDTEWDDVSVNIINEELKKYNAFYREHNDNLELVFKNTEHQLVFELRWS